MKQGLVWIFIGFSPALAIRRIDGPTLRRSDVSASDDRRVASLPGNAFLFSADLFIDLSAHLKS
jgi:hypothetical protein